LHSPPHPAAGPPRPWEPRPGVPGARDVAAPALGPADRRDDPQAEIVQVPPLLARGELHVGARPLPRPRVLGPVEVGGPEPVPPRQRSEERRVGTERRGTVATEQ